MLRATLWGWRLLTAVPIVIAGWGLAVVLSWVDWRGLGDYEPCESGGNPDACTGDALFVIVLLITAVPFVLALAAFLLSFLEVRVGAAIGLLFALIGLLFVAWNSEFDFTSGLDIALLTASLYVGLLLYLAASMTLLIRGGPHVEQLATTPVPPPPATGSAGSMQIGDVVYPTGPPYRS